MIITGEMNKDILVFGSSRGARNVLASKIEEELGIKSYNLSYLGSDIEFHLFLLKQVIKHNKKPDKVILVVDEFEELIPNKYIRFRLDRLYPLVKYREIRDELVNRNEKKRFISKISILHQLNRSNFYIRKKSFNKLDTIKSCGSMPLSFQKENIRWQYNTGRKDYVSEDELSIKLKSFLIFKNLCRKNKIDLVIAFPPNFRSQNDSYINRIKELGGVESFFVNYDTSDSRYKDNRFFYDHYHLNLQGAEIFTSEIIEFLYGHITSIRSSK
jgi:hypothetical protein